MTPRILVRLTDGPPALDADGDAAWPETAGGECIFVGRTRAETHSTHGPLRRLDYEAHRALAERTLRELADAAAARFECALVRLEHAVGPVPVGAASVVVQVGCGHRDAAFAACRHLIDELKRSVPIWKREVWADGASRPEGTVAVPPTTIGGAP